MLKLNQQFQSCLKKINSIVPHYISIENRTEAEIEIDNLLVVSPPPPIFESSAASDICTYLFLQSKYISSMINSKRNGVIHFTKTSNTTHRGGIYQFSDRSIHDSTYYKAEFVQFSTFFTNTFPSLRNFVTKKSWKSKRTTPICYINF